jgi:DNA-binding HxlR family transcriptional regulator
MKKKKNGNAKRPKIPIIRRLKVPFEKWLSLPNHDVVDVVAATVLANRLPGEPLWLALVGPSSSGKTEVVRSCQTLVRTHRVDHFTTATFASGFRPSGTKARNLENHGLLNDMMDGEPHIVVIEDFSVVLGKRWDVRNEIMNQFRKLYDGAWKAPFGNGVNIDWKGKCGMIVCSTGQFDREMGAQSVFGDRFLVCRNQPGNPVTVAEKAGSNSELSGKMREEMIRGMKLLDKVEIPKASLKIAADVHSFVAKLTAFTARARTHVPREGKTHEIIAVPEIEGTGRISAQLHQLLRGLMVLRELKYITSSEIEIIERVAFGTIPSLRLTVLEEMDVKEENDFNDLMDETGIPRSVLRRTLEDLNMLEIVQWTALKTASRRGTYSVREQWRSFVYRIQNVGGQL